MKLEDRRLPLPDSGLPEIVPAGTDLMPLKARGGAEALSDLVLTKTEDGEDAYRGQIKWRRTGRSSNRDALWLARWIFRIGEL